MPKKRPEKTAAKPADTVQDAPAVADPSGMTGHAGAGESAPPGRDAGGSDSAYEAAGRLAVSQDAPASTAQSRQSREWAALRGTGLWILYCPSQLNIMWENGSNLIVRLDAATTSAEFRQGQDPGVVELRIEVRMDNPPGINGLYSALLSFPADHSPGVQHLAEMLYSRISSDGETAPDAEIGSSAQPPVAKPDAQPSASKPPMPQPAPVRIEASARHWTDDRDWIGLYPPRETERLLAHGDRPVQDAEHPKAI